MGTELWFGDSEGVLEMMVVTVNVLKEENGTFMWILQFENAFKYSHISNIVTCLLFYFYFLDTKRIF